MEKIKRMKGQFFLVGALVVCMLLYAGLAPLSVVQSEPAHDVSALSNNMQAEMPRALNIGINSSDPAGTLISFCNFSRSAAANRDIEMEGVFLVFEAFPTGIVASAGNAAAEDITVGVSVSGTYRELTVPAGAINVTTFPAAGETFDVYMYHSGETSYVTIPSNKTSLIATVILSRGGTVIRKEILA
jgi:hypothetical protein